MDESGRGGRTGRLLRPEFAERLKERAAPLPEMAVRIAKDFGMRIAPELAAWFQDRPGLR